MDAVENVKRRIDSSKGLLDKANEESEATS
jgi:hypothetical protein